GFYDKDLARGAGLFPHKPQPSSQLRRRHSCDRPALCLSLPPVYLTGRKLLHGHGQGLSTAPDRFGEVALSRFGVGSPPSYYDGSPPASGSSTGLFASLLSRPDLADVGKLNPEQLPLPAREP